MIQSIIEAIKQFFGFGQKIAENKALKIPLKEKSILSEAEKDAQHDKNKTWKKSKFIPKREIEAAVKALWIENNLMGLKNKRERNKLIELLTNNIISGDEVSDLGWEGEKVRYTLTRNSVEIVKYFP